MAINRRDIFVALFNLGLGLGALLLVCGGALAAEAPRNVAYMVDGKEVDPRCLYTLTAAGFFGTDQPETIDIRECGNWEITRTDDIHGNVGFSDGDISFSYQDMGLVGGYDILWISFSEYRVGSDRLLAIKRDGNILSIAHIYTAGEEIDHVSITNGHLFYTNAASASDLLRFAGSSGKIVMDDSDFEYSGVAVVHFRDDQWTSIDLTRSQWIRPEGSPHRFQACFDSVYDGYVRRGKTKLDRQGVTQFATDFYTACTKDKD